MMDRVLVESPIGVVQYYAEEYSLLDKLQGDNESTVSIALTLISLPSNWEML